MNKLMKHCAIATMALLLALPALAQEDELKSMPGYVDFGTLDAVYGEPKVRVNIGGFLLSFMSQAAKEDPDAAALMEGLEGVRINIYSTEGEIAPAMDQLQDVKDMLSDQNWEPIVQVNEDDENVQIFMKADGEGMQGLTVMVVNAEEAVFLNILGSIDPDQIGAVMDQFDVDMDID
ncbi:MAG: DUF4252 domain-containing protein [Pseudomonadota bacterium]